MKDGRKGRLARIARPNEHYAVECSGFYFCLEYMKLGARKASNQETSTGTDKKKNLPSQVPVAHACNPSRQRSGESQFKASLGK
jgi:hypothetical protein